MDDQRIGSLLRVLRIRRGLRQVDVAILAGVSDGTVSRIERGHLEQLSVVVLRRIARVLESRLELSIWSRAGDIERVASSRHAALVEAVIAALEEAGWTARPEVSFSLQGERGLIDILAWDATTGSLLVIEVKTEIIDVAEVVGTLDRKRRLAPAIARQLGLDCSSYSCALIVADTRTNHRRVAEHRATFRAALAHGGQGFRAFLQRPAGSVAALAFWPIRHPGTARHPASGVRRVRRPGSAPGRLLRNVRPIETTVLTGRQSRDDVDAGA